MTRWYQRVGPSLITVCVVIGPGSIMTSSVVGANHGNSMLWVVLVSALFMLVYMSLGAKLGAVATASPGDLIRARAGRGLAITLGLCVFFISAAFQSGNSIGVAAALEAYLSSGAWVAAVVIALNAVAIAFLFAFQNLYRMLERVMTAFVAIMLVSFAINLIALRPNPLSMARGLIPSVSQIDLSLLGMIGTTFVIAAAYYQAYLVRQKGWDVDRVRSGIVDARIGSCVMALITIMLMSTAATALYTGQPVTLGNPLVVAEAMERTFGPAGKVIFCLGLFSAAYSSFLINSMIGGFILADGLGLSVDPHDLWPRLLTALVLVAGMCVALAAITLGFDRTPTIIAAQAVTVVVAPLVAIVLLWLTSLPSVMGRHVSGPLTKLVAGIGLLVLIAIAAQTALIKLPAEIKKYSAEFAAVRE